MISLTLAEKKLIQKGMSIIEIKGKQYYVKYSKFPVMELVGEQLAKLVGVKCAHYELVKINGYNYLISENLTNQEYEFVTAYDYGLGSNSLYNIWNWLEQKRVKNIPIIMNKIIRVYFFDTILRIGDRHNNNWGFLLKNDEIEDVCILDNEQLLFNHTVHMNTNIYMEEIAADIKRIDSIKDLDVFLKEANNLYIDAFKEIYEKLNPDNVLNIIKDVCQKEEIDYQYLVEDEYMGYVDYYQRLGEIINQRGLK